MKVRKTLLAATLVFLSAPALALRCTAPIESGVEAKPQRTAALTVQECALEGEAALRFSGQLSSSLVRARGFVLLHFLDAQGKVIHSLKRGPWLGRFANAPLDDATAVPASATRIRFQLQVESVRTEAAGDWRIRGLRLVPGVALTGGNAQGPVISNAHAARWRFSTIPASASGMFHLELRDQDGKVRFRRSVPKNAQVTEIDSVPLPIGYYEVMLRFQSQQGESGRWTSAFVVLPEGAPPGEFRFGMDAALSWYGGTPKMVDYSAKMMRLAGIGSVRDRLTWSQVEPTRGNIQWGRYEEVARIVAQAGLDQVQIFNDSPVWTHPNIPAKDRQPPLDDNAVFEFGRHYAQGLGKIVRNIEYWNEQNSDFFSGYPYQYASGLKAFSAGVKSVDPKIRVLIGSASGQPGRFFDEIYQNGVSGFFDTRNWHYYGTTELDHYLQQHVTPLEQKGGSADKPGWITERGYSLQRDASGDWRAAEREQAAFLVKTYAEGFANGYERVFFFFWKELLEAELHTWGIVREDFSPRPAYFALALLTRHLAGAPAVAFETHGNGRTVYFKKPDGRLVGVSWGEGNLNRLEGSVEIRDIFGQSILPTSPERLRGAPILLAGIERLPATARPIRQNASPLRASAPLRLSAALRIDGKDHVSPSGNQIATSVPENATVEIVGRVFSQGQRSTVECLAGAGMTLLSPAQFSLAGGDAGVVFSCRFKAALTRIGESHVMVRVQNGADRDVAKMALIPDARASQNFARAQSLTSNFPCPQWVPHHSANLSLQLESVSDFANRCAMKVSTQIHQQGGSWVFPALQISANALMGASGVRLRIGKVPGKPFPPLPLLVQLVEKTGGIWLVDLQRNNEEYTGLLKLAHAAPWARDNNARLDLDNLREIMIGWGGYRGEAGQSHAFVVENVEILTQ
jgi:hypothetical protein